MTRLSDGKCLSCIGGHCQCITALSPWGATGDFVPRTGLRQVIEGGLSPFGLGSVCLVSAVIASATFSPRGAAGDFVPRTGLRQVIEGGLSPFDEEAFHWTHFDLTWAL